MVMKNRLRMASIMTLGILALGFGTGLCAEPCNTCDSLAHLTIPNVTINSATLVEATATLPEHCRIEGGRFYDHFIIKLPTDWNERYYQVGNGADAGLIQEAGIDVGIAQGFASASGSGGHTEPNPIFPTFAFAYPSDDAAAQQKLNDYCQDSVHETMLLAKMFMAVYYCDVDGPEYAYYNSCSTGGRQGLIEAQRFPEDFDGLLIGAPSNYLTEITTRGVWEGQQLSGTGAVDPAKLPLLSAAVMEACDDIDGLEDGLINDPRNCTFDALADLPACANDVDGADCFTTAQRQAIYNIYDGPRTSDGTQTTFGEAYGSEAVIQFPAYLGGGTGSGWMFWIVPPPPMPMSLGLSLGDGFVKYAGLPPSGEGGVNWDYTTFDFNADFDTVVNNMSTACDAIDPDLSTLQGMGGKMIMYGGWSDPATGPYQWVNYYEEVLSTMGDAETKEFFKLYMIPGMSHCGGGLGCFDSTVLFDALVDWVENGTEPATYTGAGVNSNGDPRTRPMCPFPQVAVYSGSGNIDDATNFTCEDPTAQAAADTTGSSGGGSSGCFISTVLESR